MVNRLLTAFIIAGILLLIVLGAYKNYQENNVVDVRIIDNTDHIVHFDNLCFTFTLVKGKGSWMRGSCDPMLTRLYNMRRGKYEVKIWLGSLEKVETLLYTGRFTVEQKEQYASIKLKNAAQKITVFVADPDREIPESVGGVEVKPYSH